MTFSPNLAIPLGTVFTVQGTLCGVSTIDLFGTLLLSSFGSSCNSGTKGNYAFDMVTIHETGYLGSIDTSMSYLSTLIYTRPGGILDAEYINVTLTGMCRNQIK